MAFCMRQNAEEHYRDHYETGVYACASCGYELFSSRSKFEHHSEWPAFSTTVHEDSLTKVPEEGRPGALRVSCGKCDYSLGHEFQNEGPDAEKKLSRF